MCPACGGAPLERVIMGMAATPIEDLASTQADTEEPNLQSGEFVEPLAWFVDRLL
jgi:hypothetical protein